MKKKRISEISDNLKIHKPDIDNVTRKKPTKKLGVRITIKNGNGRLISAEIGQEPAVDKPVNIPLYVQRSCCHITWSY